MIDTDLLSQVRFPDPREADEYGLVAIGGDYRPEVLLVAYASGIFPWPSEELPQAWFSPDPRMVLFPEELHISRSLGRTLKRRTFEISLDTAFDRVVQACAQVHRPDQGGTWITPELSRGFSKLHRLGLAHSVETWLDGRLVGGCYGLALGDVFCGESMFHHCSDASKVAFVHLVLHLRQLGFRLVDCQIHTSHLESLGARKIPRDQFLDLLAEAFDQPAAPGLWVAEDQEGPDDPGEPDGTSDELVDACDDSEIEP